MASLAASPTPLFYPDWQPQYEAALMETDQQKLAKFVAAAEIAILSRLQVVVRKAGHEQERIAISDALHALRYLKGTIAV
jgi:hypothetical protein